MKKGLVGFITSWLFISGILFLASAILMMFIVWSKLLPMKYIYIIFAALVVLFLAMLAWIKPTKKNKEGSGTGKAIGKIVAVILSIGMIMVSCYGYLGIDKLKKIMGGENTEYNHYSIYVLKESEITTIEQLHDGTIEVCYQYDDGLNDVAIGEIQLLDLSVNMAKAEDYDTLVEDLYSGRTKAILVDTSYNTIIETTRELFEDEVREIWGKDFDPSLAGTGSENIEFNQREFLITEDCFNIYISGMDSVGTVASKSRTDVNLVVTVNPKTKQILLTSIPRDYFVELADKKAGSYDKLTHSGIGGVLASTQTIANLLDIDIDYYFKVNFTSLVKIVDALGGVTVYSPVAFTTYHGGYSISAGDNYMDGDKALCFVRERYSLAGGDNDRVKNQQRLLKAMIEKACSPAIITNYTKLLAAVDGLFITNMTSDEMISLINMQLNDMSSWTFITQSCTGSGQTRTDGYYIPGQALYYMIPNQESVTNAHNKITAMMNGETLE